jgi:aminodeoxyfutalosine deaminase
MIITSSKLISCKQNVPPLDKGAVAIRNGIIQSVGTVKKLKSLFPRQAIVQLADAVLLPGLVNLHTHIELPPLLDSLRAETFSQWVLNLIRAKRNLTRRDYENAASINIDTLTQTGTTTVGEICTHGSSQALLPQRGLRAVVFKEIINMGIGVRGRGSAMQLRVPRNSSLTSYGISPHSTYTVAEDVLSSIMMQNKRFLPLAMHIAESKDEIRLMQRKTNSLEKLYQFANWELDRAPRGLSALEYLGRIGFLSPHLLAVHCVQVTDNDIRLIRNSKVSVAHCPRSNKELGVGRMPLKKFLDAGVTVGLGTDSLASVPTLNMWDEMRYAYRIHHRDGISAENIFRLATVGGAKALGLDQSTGSLEVGKKADIIAVPLPEKSTGDLYSDLLRETNFCIMSMVDGKMLFHERNQSHTIS